MDRPPDIRMRKLRKTCVRVDSSSFATLGHCGLPMTQRRQSVPFVDHLLALAVAVALPLLALIWLLQPDSSLPLHLPSTVVRDGLSLEWVAITSRPAEMHASPVPAAAGAIEKQTSDLPSASDKPMPPASASMMPAMAPAIASEATVGLPAESGGSVYDPSAVQSHAIPVSSRLISAPLSSVDSPARVDPTSLAEHAPFLTTSFRRAGAATAIVEATVDRSGLVVEVNVIQSSEDAHLDTAILDAARKWSYEPAREGGEAVTSRLQLDVTVEFGAESDGSVMTN